MSSAAGGVEREASGAAAANGVTDARGADGWVSSAGGAGAVAGALLGVSMGTGGGELQFACQLATSALFVAAARGGSGTLQIFGVAGGYLQAVLVRPSGAPQRRADLRGPYSLHTFVRRPRRGGGVREAGPQLD